MSIGKLQGPEHSHSIQKTTKEKEIEEKEMLKIYGGIFSSHKIEDLQASYKAYEEKTEEKNPLNEKELKAFKKGQYPFKGKNIQGPCSEIPLNRIGG